MGAYVVGVSRDAAASHQNFRAQQRLPFPLLADTDEEIVKAFGVLVEKKNYGRTSLGVARSTFLIDPDGVVRKVWPKVSVACHAAEVLAALAKLADAPTSP
ncbi:MAG: redoxin domain-containing protein [Candidatus Eremiobacteraeota bacterium]|nr:redoxin domain-containing protein [Candidatus Eremiobacteraeota bacterium]MBC5827166.1 redoxin domain-containing protein [Candidatus Eremiobacteraeota bacterium]